MLRDKKGGIIDHFLNLWYELNWDLTPDPRTISEHYSLGRQILFKQFS